MTRDSYACKGALASVPEAIAEIRAGRFVIIADDEKRENEGDLVIGAERITPSAINFMATHARGLICLPIIGERLDELDLPLMVPRRGPMANGAEPDETGKTPAAFTVSVDAAWAGTGISAIDRASTVRAILDPGTGPGDLVRPGHVFPLRYAEGGVLRRPGHTEASVDLAVLAGLYPAAVICEVMNEDGSMARMPDLLGFGYRHAVAVTRVCDLIQYVATAQITLAGVRIML